MKVLSVALSLLFSAAFIQTAAGITCDSSCSACWKIGSPGVDVKIGCWGNNCPDSCPDGYENIHCAEWQRCMWVDPLICLWWHIFSSSSSGLTKLSQIVANHLGVQNLAHVFVDSTWIYMGGNSAMKACVVRIWAAELLIFVINSKLVYIVIFFSISTIMAGFEPRKCWQNVISNWGGRGGDSDTRTFCKSSSGDVEFGFLNNASHNVALKYKDWVRRISTSRDLRGWQLLAAWKSKAS